MHSLSSIGLFLAGALCATGLGFTSSAARPQDSPQDMAKMMSQAAKYTQPGKHHKILERFLGDWDYEVRIMGMAPTKGSATWSWLVKGRWLQSKAVGTMMGRPMESHSVMGYDNFKKSFVVTFVSSVDTAMNRAEGDLDRSGKKLTTYGRMDEYLTGEHDKMVKYEWEFVSKDEIKFGVHDLVIGEPNTKVVSIHYKRKKD